MTSRIMTDSAAVNVVAAAMQKASRSLIRDFGEIEHLQVSRKSLGDFVSSADHRAEKTLIQELSKARPNYGFLTEESGEIPGNDPEMRWVIDPLDGTTNFLHGIPHFAISVGLQKGDEIVVGVVYNPVTDELFWAEKGKGAFLNQRRLRVSGRRNLDECLLATGSPFGGHGNPGEFIATLQKVMPMTAGLRRFGSASLDLAFVAAGRYDGFFETHLKPWDMAAGLLLIAEAGGLTTEFDGGNKMLTSGSLLAGNEFVHARLKELV